ncbi:MAG TPA: hypothetical protein VNX86_09460 [Rhizomicrobium sp.]|nr:hypothetical protein [Rhizomicrobium sp.]
MIPAAANTSTSERTWASPTSAQGEAPARLLGENATNTNVDARTRSVHRMPLSHFLFVLADTAGNMEAFDKAIQVKMPRDVCAFEALREM